MTSLGGLRGLDGRVAFVTGAGRGMGRAIATRLADEGVLVAVTDLDGRSATETAAALSAKALGLRVDVTSAASVAAGVAEATGVLGPIGILVNNAGWDRLTPFLDTDEDFWETIIDINLKGPMRCCQAVLPGMVERGGGRVVNISSDAGRVGSMGESVYSGAKAGIVGLSKTLAREMARHGITVNVICPGPTETPLLDEVMATGGEKVLDAMRRSIPLRRLGQPTDIAAAVAFFASDDAAYITGQTLSVSGGLTMV